MNAKVMKVLEYDKIILQLTDKATSESGKQMCRALKPSCDIQEIKQNLNETEDAVNRILKKGSVLFNKNKNIVGLLKSLDIGCSLTTVELLKIADSLECALKLKNYGRSDRDDEETDSLSSILSCFHLTQTLRTRSVVVS